MKEHDQKWLFYNKSISNISINMGRICHNSRQHFLASTFPVVLVYFIDDLIQPRFQLFHVFLAHLLIFSSWHDLILSSQEACAPGVVLYLQIHLSFRAFRVEFSQLVFYDLFRSLWRLHLTFPWTFKDIWELWLEIQIGGSACLSNHELFLFFSVFVFL